MCDGAQRSKTAWGGEGRSPSRRKSGRLAGMVLAACVVLGGNSPASGAELRVLAPNAVKEAVSACFIVPREVRKVPPVVGWVLFRYWWR